MMLFIVIVVSAFNTFAALTVWGPSAFIPVTIFNMTLALVVGLIKTGD